MAKETDEIVVGANGTVRVAPVGTAVPVGIAASYAGTWIDLGYTSEDGVTVRNSRTTVEIPVWQLMYAARRAVTGRDFTVAFVLRQWNESIVPFAFGGGSIATTAGPPAYYTYTPPDPEDLDERALSVEWTDEAKTYRLHIPRGIVTENVETKIARANAADLPITFGVVGADGVTPWTLITNDPAFAA